MTLWIMLAVMTGAAVLAVLWPLSGRTAQVGETGDDARFYRDQIAEIARDSERGLLSPTEAEAARAEAGRRLLRSARAQAPAGDTGEPALRRRRAAIAIALSTIPLVSLALYGAYGSPHLPGQPVSARLQSDPKALELATTLARIEAHLAKNPQDGRGWDVVAPVYLRVGRPNESARAYEQAIRLVGENAQRLTGLGEALVTANEGIVPANARTAFERSIALDAGNAKARLFRALAAEQDGDLREARQQYAAIVETSPADAPWLATVKERLDRLPGTEAAAAIAGLPAAERDAAIRGMVEGLSSRLAAGGGTAEDWFRLIRSHATLGEGEKALASLQAARQALASDPNARAGLDRLARDLGLSAGLTSP